MAVNEFQYKNKRIASMINAPILSIGIAIGYSYCKTGPWETSGSFICGIVFGLFVICMSLKRPNKSS